ncbi:hypothetical protein ET475_08190 [Microbacterium protaetiae]|uniref:Uncharacterized protein n=1 Tax=Microbacterium protaetiae TaxID=2509458 RepID=A0A4P6EE03_9MICO|nr:hypothetical protein [Microbacterium protaetiae]QAY59976.1 hypothetical protein ET475_08190 [Microbacterium protaetiae]
MGVLPKGATNQYLYMGGLAPVADVLTRAVDSDEMVQTMRENGAEVAIARDGSATGPVILLTVTADSDDAAATMIDDIVAQTAVTLDQLQAAQNIPEDDRVTVSTISVDTKSTVHERSRMVRAGAAGVAIAMVALILASVIDGLKTKRRRGKRTESTARADARMEDLDPLIDDSEILDGPRSVPAGSPQGSAEVIEQHGIDSHERARASVPE